MPWVSPTHTIEAELAGIGAGWTDLSVDLTRDPITVSYGIKSYRPEIRVAETGSFNFGLINDTTNSGAVLGWYSPFNAAKRSGWRHGIRVRLKQVYGADTRYLMGWLDQIIPEPGIYEGRMVRCVVLDWMSEAARTDAPTVIQINKRSDEVFSAVLANVTKQPALTSIDTGRDTYTYALDNVTSSSKAMAIFADIAKSELGIIACTRDATDGQTLKFESRTARTIIATVLATLNNSMIGLSFPGGREDILNLFRVTAFPRLLVASQVIAKIDAAIDQAFAPGESRTLFLDYTDPVQRDTKIGATNQINPVVTTDYTMNTLADGTGTNLSASFTVTASFWSSSVKLVITNTHASSSGFVLTMQCRGDAIYALNPVTAEAESSTSRTDYGTNVALLEMLYQSNALVASDAALHLKETFKDPLANIGAVTFVANQSAALLTAAITGDISSRIRIVETMSGVTAALDYFINGVEFEISETEVMTTTWWLTPASTTVYWQLGVAGASELGNTTRLAY